jgi:hypothetical protein
MKRVRKTDGAHLPLGNAQGAAVVAALVAILLAPVVCRGLLRGDDPHPARTGNGQAGASVVNDANSPSSKRKDSGAQPGERRKQIAEDSAQLLKMATDLKAEVDKTNKDTLSVSVVRKAGAIERLAHDVRGKMKTSMGMD